MKDNLLISEQLKSKKIFITGASGWLGRHLLDFLLERDCNVVCLSRNPDAFLNENPQYKCFSWRQGAILDYSFPEENADYLIHMATPPHQAGEEQQIIAEACRIIDYAVRDNVKRLLFTSSGAVYGSQNPSEAVMPETRKCCPATAYGRGKLAAENLFLSCPVPTVIARCFAFIGQYLPLNDNSMALCCFMRNALNGVPLVVRDGSPIRTYLDCDELAYWLTVLLLRGENNGIYNVGGDQPISIIELAEIISQLATPNAGIICEREILPVAAAPRYVPDISKAKSLGLVPEFNPSESIHKVRDYYSNRNY